MEISTTPKWTHLVVVYFLYWKRFMLTFRLESLGKELLRHNSLWVASFFASDSNFARPDFCFFYQKVFF